MNYSRYLSDSLTKNSRTNKNSYTLSSKKLNHKKNKHRILLLSSLLSILIFVVFFSNTGANTLTPIIKSISKSIKSNSIQSTPLDLPEIAHHSDISSETPPLVPVSDEKLNSEQKKIGQSSQIPTKSISLQKTTLISKTLDSIETPDSSSIDDKQSLVKKEFKLPALSKTNTAKSNIESKTVIVKKGDSLSAIFKRLSLSATTLHKIMNSGKEAKRLTRIKPGQKFTILLSKQKFESLHYHINSIDTLIISKKDKTFVSHLESKDIQIQHQFASVTIENSLFLAGSKAGLSVSTIMELAQIFGWDIDFALDVRKGDSFTILYEEKFVNDKKIANGHILSAEFINRGKVYQAVRFTDSSGHTDYYSEKGLSMRKAFLRTPVEFSRISSRFSLSRNHPLLKRKRPHKGVDYAASRGTPIKAVGDGKVIFKGNKGGYGRVIILQHGSKYSTLYAHMNSYNRKMRNGRRVKQGQTIGYVGSSGLATGPHLHYEFRVHGVHRNPLTVSLPSAAPIAKKYRHNFQTTAETLISQLKLRKQETIALKD
ncbi:MAG: peptidoglycan DD-metalloendopeptidase family protein [gamma proteobacterium symbiont of Taylorina sp.]|nr:peptidoglycan DD-metalloendopeptidase family protein [gamma proteobacterium symbiont of Taylorina sp.]